MDELTCTWGKHYPCGQVEYILGNICDKCGETSVIDLCGRHYEKWKNTVIRCLCGGTISWEAKHVYTRETESKFNKSSL